jgi:hypothetical protein
MFGSTKELLMWIAGMLVAAGITILAVIYLVDHFIAPHDSSDPLTIKGGLDRQQRIEAK